ncbi:MAG: DUF748 domain-containing protein [Gammaproteobacteria bacterium]|nr:DUF748 domain-containing protein [Gammaproteobacteria bacterium]
MSNVLADFFKKHPWLSSLTLLLALVLWLLPYGVKLGIEKALLAQGVQQVSIDDIDLNLFRGQFRLEQLQIQQDNHVTLRIQQLDAAWRWRDLLQQHWVLRDVHLQNATIDIRQTDAEHLTVGGLTLPLGDSENQQAGSSALPAVGIKTLTLENVSLQITPLAQPASRYHIQKLALNDLYSWQTQPAALILNSDLNGARFNAHLQLDLFAKEPKIVGTIRTQQLDLAHLPLPDTLKAQLPGLSGLLSTDLTFTAQQRTQGVQFNQQGTLSLEQVALAVADLKTRLERISWSGDVSYIERENHPQVHLQGKLQLANLDLYEGTTQTQLQQSMDAELDLTAILKASGIALTQNGQLIVKQLNVQQPEMQVALDSGQYQGVIRFEQNDTASKLDMTGKLTAQAVAIKQAEQSIQQDIDSDLQLQAKLTPQSLQITQNGTLQLNQLQWQQAPLQAELGKLLWQGEAAYAQQGSAPAHIQAKGRVQSENFRALSQQQPIADLAELAIQKLELNGLNNLRLAQIRLKDLTLPDQPEQPFIQLGSLQVDQAALQNLNYLDIGQVHAQNAQALLAIDANHQIAEITRLQQRLSTGPAPTVSSRPSEEKPAPAASTFHYRIAAIQVDGQNPVHLTLNQFAEPISKKLEIDNLTIGTLDSQKPQSDTTVKLSARIDEFANLSSQGKLQPLNPELEVNLQSRIEGLNLVAFSPASREFVGYDIASGQLSANFDTQIKNQQINAENTLKLNKLELKTADANKSAEFQKGLSMPLDAALGLLRDKDDNIKLKLPVTGDLSNPDFDLQHVINTALSGAMKTATKTYLLLALQPFGAIALAGNYLTDQAGAIHLQAVDFSAGESALNPQMQDYLQKIAKLLNEKRKIQIKVCGAANEYDRQILLHKLAKTLTEAKPPEKTDKTPAKPLPAPQISDEELLNLATERANQIKRQLLQLGAKTEQVIICQPRLDADRNPPKVSLGI